MVREVLEERGKSYGKYSDGIETRVKIMEALTAHSNNANGEFIPDSLIVPLHDIVNKIVRMVADPSNEDNYTDLAGYAELLREVRNEGK